MTEFAQNRLSPADAMNFAAILAGIMGVVLTAFLGGMPALLLVFAGFLAARIYQYPQEVIVTGPLFLLAVNVFFPSVARFDAGNTTEPWEMYYWACGILLITLAALLRLKPAAVLRLPKSLLIFLLVSLVASIYGIIRGNEPSYIFRQWFGSLLFGAYFLFATNYGNEEYFFRKIRAYAVPCMLAFVVYYVAVFSQYGVHKEITTLGTQGGILATLFAAKSGWRWWSSAAILVLGPVLLVERRSLAAFALSLVLICAWVTSSKFWKWSLFVLSGFLVVLSLAPTYVELISDAAVGSSTVDRILPDGARDASSIEDRSLQLVEAGFIVVNSPLLGNGMGSMLAWQSAVRGQMEQAYVDNGWAYVATKMGLCGLIAFIWFVAGLIRRMNAASMPLSVCLLSTLLIVMWAEPVFFQFTTSPFMGVVAGLLWGSPQTVSHLQTVCTG
ncbi:MAG TPA: hypothetical protein VFA74_00175 [Terriglobales bacterium]|nr:hypothetical protein [Terriglobales bacterium]